MKSLDQILILIRDSLVIVKMIQDFLVEILLNNENETTIKKGVFTTCKVKGKCPAWSISADGKA